MYEVGRRVSHCIESVGQQFIIYKSISNFNDKLMCENLLLLTTTQIKLAEDIKNKLKLTNTRKNNTANRPTGCYINRIP
jgi:hypothetical protein